MGVQTRAVRPQPNATRRFYGAGTTIFAVALGLYQAWGLRFELPLSSAPLGVGLTAMVAAQHLWRVNNRDSFRRSSEALDGLPFTIGAFFLPVGWFIVMVVVGPFIAWTIGDDYTPRLRWLQSSVQAVIAVVVAYLFTVASPAGPLDSPEALLLCFGIWLAIDAVRVGESVVYQWVRHGRIDRTRLVGRLKGFLYHGTPVMMGYLLAVAVVAAYWMIPVILFAIALMFYLFAFTSQSGALEARLGWMSQFFARVDRADSAEQVENALVGSFNQFAVLTSFGVARASGSGKVRWNGDVAPAIRNGLASEEQLEELSEAMPSKDPFGIGTIWVWPIDSVRRSYVVITGVMSSWGIGDVTRYGGYLVDSARLAIATARRRREFEVTAAREFDNARTDALTGLPNRLRIVEEVDSLLRVRPSESIAVLQATLVGFQHTVGVLGAEAGDQLLLGFSSRLQRIARESHQIHAVGRGLDDAFLIVAAGDSIDVGELANRISAPTGDPAQNAVTRDAWVGSAFADDDRTVGGDELVQRAHFAMDRSEREGAPMTFGPDDVARERRRISVRLRLPRAIEAGDVQPAFQPQIDLTTREVVGCEVLARWADTQIGAVTPNEFVEISEQSQQIELLTVSLLLQALQLDLTHPSGRPVPLSVNVSARSIGNDVFVKELVALISESGREIGDFTFEIAESTVASDGLATIFGIDHLRTLGARVSIDDFGTGNSTLSYLDKLPVHEIKIDRSLTSTIGTFDTPSPVIRHLIGLCDDLGLDVVSEGIESTLQRDLARELGCRRAQGYLFARPMAPTEAAEWISSYVPEPAIPLIKTP